MAGGFCALHSVANAIALPGELYDCLYAEGPLCELEQIRAVINEWNGTPKSTTPSQSSENGPAGLVTSADRGLVRY